MRNIKDIIIPELYNHCQVPIIRADQSGEKPTGTHATYKITTPYMKGIGHADELATDTVDGLEMTYQEQYKIVVSFTAYDMDDLESYDLAEKILHWFLFHGRAFLDYNGIVLADHTPVDNRDAFVVDGYERRNGFDVTLRASREVIQTIDWIETVDIKGGEQ